MNEPSFRIDALFPTLIYRADNAGPEKLTNELRLLAMELAKTDIAGRRWCGRNSYPGYTSYGSIDDLCPRFPSFHQLELIVERHSRAFIKALHWDVRGARPYVDSLWVNVLPPGGSHTSHLHTNAVLSGTYYVSATAGAGPIVFEDPRHAMMMAAPPRKSSAPPDMSVYASVSPEPGMLLLWESWLRHEVAMNRGSEDRISVSFNCVLR